MCETNSALPRAPEVLSSETVSASVAGQNVIEHLLLPEADHGSLENRIRHLESAFGRLVEHERTALKTQLQAAVGPESKKFLRSALAECAGGLLCEMLKFIVESAVD